MTIPGEKPSGFEGEKEIDFIMRKAPGELSPGETVRSKSKDGIYRAEKDYEGDNIESHLGRH